MKAIIEGKLKTMLITTVEIYVEVLNAIIDSNNEQELRNNMNEIEERYNSWKGDFSMFFEYGFGSHHMWFKEVDSSDRLIFVEF
jgi:hypothetical protein